MKKLLSIILVLAMLLGMTAMPVFAGSSSDYYVYAGKTITLTGSSEGSNKLWKMKSSVTGVSVNASTGVVTTTSTAGDKVAATIEQIAYTDATHTTPEAVKATRTVMVINPASGYFSLDDSIDDVEMSVGTEKTLDPELYLGSTKVTDSDYIAACKITWASDTTTVATVDNNGKVSAKAAGTAEITATLKIGDEILDTYKYDITVEGIDITTDIENGDKDTDYDTASDIKYLMARAINEAFAAADIDDDDISSITLKKNTSNAYGTLKTAASSPATVGTTAVRVDESGVTFEAEKACIGKMTYDVVVITNASSANSATYKGTWTFNVTAIEDIEDEQTAEFAKMSFNLDMPSSDLEYIKDVGTETPTGNFLNIKSSTYDHLTYTPSNSTKATETIYVVALDDDGYVHFGTIDITGVDCDFSYIGAEDKEVAVDEDDFLDLFEAIADAEKDNIKTSSSTYTTELTSVVFDNYKTKEYQLYLDDKEMKTKTVDADDLEDLEIVPLVSKKVYINFTMNGDRLKDGKKNGTVKYYGRLLVNAVAGDVKYSVVAKSSVQFNEYDFEDFFEDAVDSSSAILQYIVLDTSDLKSTVGTVQVPYSVGKASVYSAIEDNEKLYFDEDDTTTRSPYVISDARFTAAGTVATGTKVYIPFTAYGKKGSKPETAEGYVEVTIINNPFTDLTASWYKDAVLWAYGHTPQITKGTNLAGTLFSPEQACTRAQAVTFLYRAAGAPTVSASEKSAVLATFKDVNATKHKDFVDAIAWAKAKGITSGTSATTFGPDKTCTRAQIVTFIYNYAKSAGKSVTTQFTNGFTDVKPTTTHKSYANAIQWAVEQEITNGINTAGTLFGPDQTCTRGHIVTFLYNYFN